MAGRSVVLIPGFLGSPIQDGGRGGGGGGGVERDGVGKGDTTIRD